MTFSPLRIWVPCELGVARRGAPEVRERREHPQRLLDRPRDQRRIIQQQPALRRILQQRAHRTAVRRLRAVVPRRHQQEEPHHDLVLLELLPIDLRMHQHARQVIRRIRPPIGDQLPAALEDLGDVALHHGVDALGVHLGIVRAEDRVHQPRPDHVVLTREAHEAADHPRHDRLGDLVDQIARLTTLEAIEHLARDRADLILVLGDPLGREPTLEQRLDPIMLGRIHPDEHRALQLQRQPGIGRRREAPELGGVGLPVAADRVHVIGLRHRPVAGLVGEVDHARRPVHRAL